MRAKLIDHGTEVFETYELIEMLLYNTIRTGNTNPQAKRLAFRYPKLNKLFGASREELMQVTGIGQKSAELLSALGTIKGLLVARSNENATVLSDSDSAARFALEYFKGESRNKVSVALLNNRLKLIDVLDLYDTDYGSGKVNPSAFMRAALNKNATAILIMHNHPYGISLFSDSDRETERLVRSTLVTIGVCVVDHILVSGSRYSSMNEVFDKSSLLLGGRGESYHEIVRALKASTESPIEEEQEAVSGEYDLFDGLARIFAFANSEEYSRRLSDRLITAYGNLYSIFSAPINYLVEDRGVSLADAVTIKVVSELLSRSETELFRFGVRHTEEEISAYLTALYLGRCNEEAHVLVMKEDRVLSCERLSEGTVNEVSVVPRRVIEAVMRHGGDGVILSHNHPDGTSVPSCEDKRLTATLSDTLRNTGARLHAHFIVAGNSIHIER